MSEFDSIMRGLEEVKQHLEGKIKLKTTTMENPEITIHIDVKDCLQDCPFSTIYSTFFDSENNSEVRIEDIGKWYCSRIASYPINTAFLILDGPNLPMIKPLHNCPYRK